MKPDIAPDLIQSYNKIWMLEHLLGEARAARWLPESRESLRAKIRTQLEAKKTPGQLLQIERRKNLSEQEFKQVYLKGGIPVVMVGAARSWPCVQKWTPQFLAAQYGDDPVALIDASPENVGDINYVPETTTLRDVILSIDEGPIKKYSRFNRILYEHPELYKDFDVKWLLRRRNLVCSGRTFQVFIGGKGTKTHLHCAAEHNLFIQVYGRKHWVIYPPYYDCVLEPPVTRTPYFHSAFNPDDPDYEAYPGMQYLDRYECILNPGDVLFNPPSYWHHVSNLSGSIGVGFRWFAPNDAFRIDATQALLTLLAVNPPIWVATANRTDFSKIFGYMSRKKRK